MNEIFKIIHIYRKRLANIELLKNICKIIIFFSLFAFILILIENIYYLSPSIKLKNLNFYTGFLILSLTYSIILWIISTYSLFNFRNNLFLAKKIGDKNHKIKDELLNAIQINDKSNNENLDLKEYAINSIRRKLAKEFSNIVNTGYPKKEMQIGILILISMVCITITTNLNQAAIRLAKYDQFYSLPLPFTLKTLSNNSSALEGDSLNINISGLGTIPDSITIKYIINDSLNSNIVSHENEIYSMQINNLKSNLTYWGEYKSSKIFSPWKKIKSDEKIITIKKRPAITNINFTIKPPIYTSLEEYEHNETNVNQIYILNGSNIKINAETQKKLTSAWILYNNERMNMEISNNLMSTQFDFKEDMKLSIYCINDEYISNINPIQYSLILQDDKNPNIDIQAPQYQFELDETMEIPIKFNAYDDFGIDRIWIEYSIESEDFGEMDTDISIYNILKTIDIDKQIYAEQKWNIEDLNLFMGEKLKFRICAADKNNITGPGIFKSNEFIGSFPSLEDLFTRIEEYENNIQDIVEDMESSIEEISEINENTIMESLKSEDLSWEQEQKLEKTFDEMEELIEEIETIQKNIDEILNEASKNNLFDQDLMQKFEQFQEMLQNMMTEEMMDAITKLQEAFKELDQNKLMEALNNYEFNVEKFEEELDRFIDMFEMAMAEQKLNELTEHIQNMIKKQNEIIDDLKNQEDDYTLNKKSQKQENKFSDFNNLLNEATKNIDDISPKTADKLTNLQNSSLTKETEKLLSEQTKNITKKDNDSSTSANETKKNLEEISDNLTETIKQFKNEEIMKMTKEFIIILDNLITISNQQEKLNNDSINMRSNSPEIKNINREQSNIDREINQITKQLITLSTQTFHINPKINRLLGKLKNSIAKTILDLEQKKINKTKNSQKENLKYINDITFLLMTSMEEMQNSNSASGFEQFLESMEQMTQQQQGINQNTMQLGQMGVMMQQSMLQQLMQQQQQLQQQLSELLNENPGNDTGGLSKAKDDMDETINDFINNNVTKKTIERQQQILSRMLDSQKSLTKKDIDKKRQSKSGDDFTYTGNDNLILEKDNDLMLINAMEDAIQEGLSEQYEKLIRLYFLELQKESQNFE